MQTLGRSQKNLPRPETSNTPEQKALVVPSYHDVRLEDPLGTHEPPQLNSTLSRAIAKVVGYQENLSKLDRTKSSSAK